MAVARMRLIGAMRRMTTRAEQLVSVEMKSSQVAIVRMNRPPVNALSKSLMSDLRHTIEELEKEKQVKGLVLTSSSKVFSAGLDLVELLNPTQEFVSSFWGELQDLWIKLYSTHLVTVAAVNGAAPAAGCMLALSCDYRMMATKNVIGMNETKFGLFAPPWFVELMADTVGRRKAENLLLQGTLLTTEEALACGMIDEIVERDRLVGAAQEHVEKTIKSTVRGAYDATKKSLRKRAIADLVKIKEDEKREYSEMFRSYEIQDKIAK